MNDRPTFQTIDPATGAKGRVYEGHTAAEAHGLVRASRQAFESWRRTSFGERANILRAAAAALRRRKDELATLMTDEMGKTVTDGLAEVEKCAGACEHFADHAQSFLADQHLEIGKDRAKVVFRPIGVVLAVMPWNFPLWQVFRCAAPALMAGNALVLKHASNVPGSALAIEEVLKEAGLPDGVFRTLLVPSATVDGLIHDNAIAAVSLTGSVEAGRKVAEAAGRALKKCVLELGGSDAYLVLEDADIEAAARIAATARMVNAGQSCIAGKRFIVLSPIREAFEHAMARQMESYVMGDPADPATKLGPLQSVSARDAIHAQVQRSLAAGARLLTGGVFPDKPGAWYPPTVLSGVTEGMPAFDEEVFGPVAAIIEASDEAEAIRLANATPFGLGSGVLTRDLKRGERIASDELHAGLSFVNQNVRSDSRLPFGGVGHSGYGRELSKFGILEFVNIKSVLVDGDG